MSSSVKIGAVEFISVKDAALRSSYTRDYITRLARDEKVVATQVKRQWFIDPVSLQNFIESAKIEREIRGQLLREERRREQQVHCKNVTSEQVYEHEHVTRAPSHAYLATASVVICGLFLGVVIHATNPVGSMFGPTNQIAQVASTQSGVRDDSNTHTTLPAVENGRPTLVADVSNDRVVGQRTFSSNEGVLLLPVGVASSEDTTVDELFSDEVTLTYRSANEGVVTPHLRDGAGTPLAFVMVPVTQASTSVVTMNNGL